MRSIKSANYASYKNWTSESIISYIQNVSQNTVNMYHVYIKIKKKNTIGLARRIVIFFHWSFPVKVSEREGQGRGFCDERAAILIVFCQCLLLIAICTNCRLEHYKIREKSDFDLHLDEGMEQVSNSIVYTRVLNESQG